MDVDETDAGAPVAAEQLQVALENRGVIDRAIGIMMSRSGGTEAEAMTRLRELSQAEDRRMAVVARLRASAPTMACSPRPRLRWTAACPPPSRRTRGLRLTLVLDGWPVTLTAFPDVDQVSPATSLRLALSRTSGRSTGLDSLRESRLREATRRVDAKRA